MVSTLAVIKSTAVVRVQNTDDVFVYDFIGEKSRRGLLKYLQKLLYLYREEIR